VYRPHTSIPVPAECISVKLPDGIGIAQPLALAVAAGGGGNQATYTRQPGTYQGGGGGDYGIT
jgi:hypothetical protein